MLDLGGNRTATLVTDVQPLLQCYALLAFYRKINDGFIDDGFKDKFYLCFRSAHVKYFS